LIRKETEFSLEVNNSVLPFGRGFELRHSTEITVRERFLNICINGSGRDV
jgi:hypothetical protein